MATAVLFIGFGRPVPGKEEEAYGFLDSEALAYLNKVEGEYFERMEVVALTAHMGSLSGCMLLFGERAKLDELRRTDEYEAFAMKLGTLFTNTGTIPGLNREGIEAVMARRRKASSS